MADLEVHLGVPPTCAQYKYACIIVNLYEAYVRGKKNLEREFSISKEEYQVAKRIIYNYNLGKFIIPSSDMPKNLIDIKPLDDMEYFLKAIKWYSGLIAYRNVLKTIKDFENLLKRIEEKYNKKCNDILAQIPWADFLFLGVLQEEARTLKKQIKAQKEKEFKKLYESRKGQKYKEALKVLAYLKELLIAYLEGSVFKKRRGQR